MSEQNLFARSAKLFYDDPSTPSGLSWVANVTEVTATVNSEGTCEGTLTIDMVNAQFESMFITAMNSPASTPTPQFSLKLNLEDPGVPSLKFDKNGVALGDEKEYWLREVKFWSMPLGFGMSKLVTRDLDFTAYTDDNKGRQREYTIRFSDSATTIDNGVSNP